MAEILGTFEQAVLLTVVRLGGDAYGRAILRELHVRLERDVAAGAVYATLDRLETKGLADSRVAPGTAVRGGRSRRHYTVTAAGIRALTDSKSTIDNIWRGMTWPLKNRA
jgi:DNA-binding PadR family transcriptional regulator